MTAVQLAAAPRAGAGNADPWTPGLDSSGWDRHRALTGGEAQALAEIGPAGLRRSRARGACRPGSWQALARLAWPLTNVTLYWLTASAGSSAQLYYAGAEGMAQAATGAVPPPIKVPVGVAVFPHDIFLPIRRLADREIETVAQWTEFDRGGHFAAMERPAELIGDLRRFTSRALSGTGQA